MTSRMHPQAKRLLDAHVDYVMSRLSGKPMHEFIEAEVDQLFAALGEKGTPVMPAQDMFWGAYFGMLTDQFGINWMFNFETPKSS